MNKKTTETIKSITQPSGLPGWCSAEKAIIMAELVLEQKPALLVELGVFGGRSFVPLCLALKELSDAEGLQAVPRLGIGIDPWSNAACIEGMDPHDANDQRNIEYWSTINLAAVHRRCADEMDKLKLWGVSVLMQARAEKVHGMFQDNSIELLHIDDNHHTAARTVELWLPKCRPGATIIFDDANWAETQNGIELLSKSAALVDDRGDWRIYRKHP